MPSLTDVAHSVEEDAEPVPDGVRRALGARGVRVTRDDDLADRFLRGCRHA